MKILVLNGSPKTKSDTMELTNAFLRGLSEGNDVEIEVLKIYDMDIKPCRGCFGCWRRGDGTCVIEDEQNDILRRYREADIVIWSFPLYCFGLPSQIKAVLDRMIPMVKMDMVEENEEVRHICNDFYGKQKTVIICGAGFPYSKGNFDGVKVTAEKCFRDPTMIFVPESPLMNVPEAQTVANLKREQFIEGGREYIKTGSLRQEAIMKMESLMIPNEEYLRNINGK